MVNGTKMTDHTPPPWAWGIAGAVIAWLLMLLKAVWFNTIASESREQKDFRDRVEDDLKRIEEALTKSVEIVNRLVVKIGVLENEINHLKSTHKE